MARHLALLALLITAAVSAAPKASIDATIRGTDQALKVELLVREGESEWKTVAHRALDATTRRVKFDSLDAGVYQLRVEGTEPTEQLATKIVLGTADKRTVTIAVERTELTGRVTYGGTGIAGALLLHNSEFHWRGGIAIADDGTFHVPLWQRGEYTLEMRGPALSTPFHDVITIANSNDIAIDIPDGRIRGVVRQANGAPIARALVVVESESTTRMYTDAEGRFDFTGVRDGHYTVRIVSPSHLDPNPIEVQIDNDNRQRDLTVDLDRGRTLPLLVVDPQQAPVIDTIVYVVAGTRVCSRTLTDADGRTNVAAPVDTDAMLFIVPRAGSFGMQRIPKQDSGTLRVHLPLALSSLLIRARTTNGAEMPPFALLMRYNGAVVPPEIADALASTQGLNLMKSEGTDIRLENIPSGSYEFWPYRTNEEAETILSIANEFAAPIQINVRTGENSVAVKFATR